ncbi:uncharacterized protein LOC131170207 [Hevea brasiliensis]|uniref:uncharacterized protein LOC131170207 n=1 Tax=Hevea brasiliensis TaxID=3981 RepID=UPI0025FB149F|nr:uncharacterized protein LOC131170207 [Hevea brasiliensis]
MRGFASFSVWWTAMSQEFKADQELLNLIAVICWNVWKARNWATFEHTNPNPIALSKKIMHFFSEMCHVLEMSLSQQVFATHPHHQMIWTPPPSGFLKFNYDAACNEANSMASAAIIVRNFNSHLVDGSAMNFHCSSPLAGEATVLLKALNVANSMGAQSVIIETDSLILYEMVVSSQKHQRWEIRASLSAIKALMPLFQYLSFSFVNWKANRATNCLSKLSVKAILPCNWIMVLPQELKNWLSLDASFAV